MLRDYKTGRAPKDDGGVFRGGQQLQIPFYVLAAEKLFPGERGGGRLPRLRGRRPPGGLPPRARARARPSATLLRDLVDLVARGVFVQEPSACDFCDFTVVCGPKGAAAAPPGLQAARPPRCRRYLRLRDIG